MGLYERDYASERRAPSGLGKLSALSVNTWIIVANVAVHLLRMFAFPKRVGVFPWPTDLLFDLGHFSTAKVTLGKTGGLEFWRFLTFQFLHSDSIMHVGMNMLGLYMFGSLVESHLGGRRYLAFYLTCGIFGGLAYLLLNALGMVAAMPGLLSQPNETPLVGASAGVFGVIMACAYIAPNDPIDIPFPPISMRMRTFAYGYLALAGINLIFGGRNAGGDAAHVGGAIAGYFFIRNAHLLRDFFDVLGDSRRPRAKRGAPKLRFTGLEPEPTGPTEDEVNRVLDKLRTSGRESLTAREQKTLLAATRAKREADGA